MTEPTYKLTIIPDQLIFSARHAITQATHAAPVAVPLTDAEIEAGRRHVFSTDNPFCPCNSKTMRKAVWWAERTLAKRWGVKLEGGE